MAPLPGMRRPQHRRRPALFSPENAYLNTATLRPPAADRVRRARRRRRRVAPRPHRLRRLGPLGRRRAGERSPGWPACTSDDVAVGAAVSAFAGLVAAALPAGARVLCAEGDFTSVLFPFLAQEARGVDGGAGAARAPPGGDRRGPRPRRGQRGAERRRAAGRPRRDRRRGRAPRRAHVHRHHAGDGLAAAGLLALRLHRVRRLQVAARPARDGVLHDPARAPRRAGPARRRLVRGRGRARLLLRRAAAAGARARAASTSRPHGCAGSAPRPRSRCSRSSGIERDPRARRRAGGPAARRARAGAGRLGDRVGRRAAGRTRRAAARRRA